MIFKTFSAGPFATNTYLIGCPLTKKAFVIDVPPESFQRITTILQEEELALENIFLTHSHHDHIGDVQPLKKATGASIWVDAKDKENLQKPGSDGLPQIFFVEGAEPDQFFIDGQKIQVGSFTIEVIATPGHTPGGVSLYMEKEGILFSGDTLFQGSIGRLDFPTARPEEMWASLKRLAKLPKETKVFSGHGPMTTIGHEPWLEQAEKKFS